ncbi:Ribonuclease H domain [Trinorchestia longiramus]|nr:Ribonuclease H domain [Trinorchestia longiramus]
MSLEGVTKGMKITNKGNLHCEICVQGKMCQYRSRDPDEKSKKPLELVHSDLAGPISPTSFENSIVSSIPKSYSEAISSPDSVEWQKAMSDEMAALVDNETFELVAKPKERSVIGGRWVYSVKSGGFRQRLVALDQVARSEAAIRSAITRREILLCLFVDLTDAFNTVWPTGVLYKLGSCGVRGPILRWLHSYLTNRSFQVYFEGSCSSERGARSGVPQGGILSPMLFNLLMSDIPIQTGVQSCEYADDLTFFTAHKDLHVATNKLQTQMDSLNKSSQEWGLKINCTKTKTMCFTNKRVTPLPIFLDRQPLTFEQKYKYLGVILDAPHLRWEPQIYYLKQTSIAILNILQSISHRPWGADREILLKLYKTLIRSRLDYAAPLYGTAAPSNLCKLNSIQNQCLRIATGCRKTTPITSLQIEADIPPLALHREEIACRYYCRLLQLPLNVATSELVQRLDTPQIGSSSLLPTFIVSVRAIFPKVGLPTPSGNAAPIISPLFPWFRTDDCILTEFLSSSVSSLTSQSVIQTYNELMDTEFRDYIAIFTDGLRITEPTCSSSAAVLVPSKGVTLNWKLRSQKQVIECELHAIHEALSWISENSAPSDKYVIFTDSLSSLYLIRSTKPKYYIPLVYNIQYKLINIISSHCIRLQFIPGHRGVSRNEAADSAAKAAHLLRYRTLTPYSKEETVSLACKAFRTRWESTWLQQVRVTGKGRYLVQIRYTSGSWPSASHRNRRVETALARLRVGHTGFRSHLFRVIQTNDPNCPCGRVETIEHVCPDRSRRFNKATFQRPHYLSYGARLSPGQ